MRRDESSWFARMGTLLIGVGLLTVVCGVAALVIRDRKRLIRERDEARARFNRISRVFSRARFRSTLGDQSGDGKMHPSP
jgi:hypothetical protein